MILVIVESPAKAKTIQSYLGSSYRVIASGGHIMDLPSNSLAVDVTNAFSFQKEIIPKKSKKVHELKNEISKSIKIFVATDPDREGEAIAYDIKSLGNPSKNWKRVAFREITKKHILEKMENPDSFSIQKLNSQSTRRVVDRLFGYLISPLLWKNIQGKLSAGRVQSVILRWICEREEEIRRFKPVDYFDLSAISIDGLEFRWVRDKDIYFPSLDFQKEWDRVSIQLKFPPAIKKGIIEFNKSFIVKSYKKEVILHHPPSPFITSSLQEVASKVLGFPPKKTMKIAQSLYEGLDIGSIRMGIITYPRTDSERINPEFQGLVKNYIKDELGEIYVSKRKLRNNNSKKIQDAHEAIRPTDLNITDGILRKHLSSDEYKLYDLIRKRTLASFTSPQKLEKETWILGGMNERWKLESEEEIFPGYMVWYEKNKPIKINWNGAEGDIVHIANIKWECKQTSPPSRYTHASLVKKMESTGVGRPSTYSPSIEVLSDRNYIHWEKKQCYPTTLGENVNIFLVHGFSEFIQDEFTRQLELDLDSIESEKLNSIEVLNSFYTNLKSRIDSSPEVFRNISKCPDCNKGIIQKKVDKKGKLIAYCSRFPDCDYGEYL